MYQKSKIFSKPCDYIPKISRINNKENNINFNTIDDSDFIKIQTIQKLNLINTQPLVLFKKQNCCKSYKPENQTDKNSTENENYLILTEFKKKNSKHLFHSSNNPKNKNNKR